MKRYTGQQALYEAISRSRAKAKHGSILEKLLPDHSKPETPAGPVPSVEPQQVNPAVEPVPQTPAVSEPVETPAQPVVEATPQVAPSLEASPETVATVAPAPVETPEPVFRPRPVERMPHPTPPGPVQTWLKPRPVQLNEGRIEISVPYYVGIIAALAALLVVLGAYRLGSGSSRGQGNESAPRVQVGGDRSGGQTNPPAAPTQRSTTAGSAQPPSNPVSPTGGRQDVATAGTQGDHWIVLAQYAKYEDLLKVKEYFAGHGISLVVIPLDSESRKELAKLGLNANALPSGSGFLLVTEGLYNNPQVKGTDGYAMKQKITEVGAKYKAPSGFERFAPNYFSDAYGMKIR